MLDVTDNNLIFEKVDKLRKERGWSCYRLATEAGVAPNTIYNWRDRKSSPTLYVLDSVCAAFGITLINFLFDEEEYSDLSKEQREIMTQWDMLTPAQKNSIISLIRSFKIG